MSEISNSSHWDLAQIERFLDTTVIPVKLACTSSNGKPLVCSLWFMYDDGVIWCATKASASVAKFLQQHPDCGFEVAPESMPYTGVRGQGVATLSEAEGMDVLLKLMDRYLGTRESGFARWLISQASDEVAIRIEPDWLTAWDFTARMQK